MLGVISTDKEKESVKEFFQLFKTPWEFYRRSQSYDAILTTKSNICNIAAKVIIAYGSEEKDCDVQHLTGIISQKNGTLLEVGGMYFPIFGKFATFETSQFSIINVNGGPQSVGVVIHTNKTTIVRIGYDLFSEVQYLISSGQPAQFAHIPTLEMHISILRNCILTCGILLVEIPPVPGGYDFITCLTHDVDFAGIRNHHLGHTIYGFLYRSLFVSACSLLKRKKSLTYMLKNWRAVLSLPLIYLGLAKDYWIQFDEYLEIEGGLPSTFYFIPFKNQPGTGVYGQAAKRRSAKYDVNDLRLVFDTLIERGCEVGVHGVDAWHNTQKGRAELAKLSRFTNRYDGGVRMHWLFFGQRTPRVLEEAGFVYDSTSGFNDRIGFKAGTTQAFVPSGAKTLIELPMHIQDTAMFYPKSMSLSDIQAFDLCKQLVDVFMKYGGALVINWHQRSLGPERYWNGFYIELLKHLKSMRVWFATSRQAVEWFCIRRKVFFQKVHFVRNKLIIHLGGESRDVLPPLILRIHYPTIGILQDSSFLNRKMKSVDFLWTGEKKIEFHL